MKYKRLTDEKFVKAVENCNMACVFSEKCIECVYFDNDSCVETVQGRLKKAIPRLAELEDKIEQGTLKEIPENAVVITGTETEERLVDLLVDFDEMSFFPGTLTPDPDEYAREWKNKLIYAIGQLRKETAEKFAERLKAKQAPLDEYDEISIGSLFADIDEILKEITEGK